MFDDKPKLEAAGTAQPVVAKGFHLVVLLCRNEVATDGEHEHAQAARKSLESGLVNCM